nr:Na+/H+ antiporter subunit E [Ancylobacter crimeensis]
MVRDRPTLHPAFSSIVFRWILFLAVWFALGGARLALLFPGLIVTALATWASLRLQPPAGNRIRPVAMAALMLDVCRGSMWAGLDVARRALAPRLDLDPGLVFYPVRLPAGPGRDAFRALMSLQPGSLPTECPDADGFLIHCLDRRQDVCAQFAAAEQAFAKAAGLVLRPIADAQEDKRHG